MNKNNDILISTKSLAIIFLIIICIVGFFVGTEGNKREVTTMVTDKGIKNYKSKSIYLVYTKDENGEVVTYKIEDSVMQGKFNSSDIYGSIEVGKKYTFVIVGERNGFLSMYPNIVKVVN